jgi:Mg-chelatase subunit ChlD
MEPRHAAMQELVMKWWLIALMCLFQQPLSIVVELESKHPVTNRVLFVVDRSGSMTGDHFTRAMDAMREVASTPTDDFQFGVIAFNDTPLRWPGRPEDKGRKGEVPPGWARSAPAALAEAQMWLLQLGAGGDTRVTTALQAAMGDPATPLTVIVVSDGLFGHESPAELAKLLRELQGKRKVRATVWCYGLGPHQRSLEAIADATGGGYLREVPQGE